MKRKIAIALTVLLMSTIMLPSFVMAEDGTTVPEEPVQTTPAEEEPAKPPKQLNILHAPSTMSVGEEGQISWELKYQEPGDDAVGFESTNPEVVLVDSSGKVVAVGPGNVEIIARAGEVTSTVLIRVSSIAANDVSIVINEITRKKGQTEFEIKVGDVLHVSALLEPEGAKVGKITWEVENPDLIDLGDDGELIALAKGRTSVTVVAGELTDTITFAIGENGIPLPTIIGLIVGGAILIIGIIIAALLLVKNSKRKKAAQKRAAEKRKHEDKLRREMRSEDSQPQSQAMNAETKIYGTAVGATKTKFEDESTMEPFSIEDIK